VPALMGESEHRSAACDIQYAVDQLVIAHAPARAASENRNVLGSRKKSRQRINSRCAPARASIGHPRRSNRGTEHRYAFTHSAAITSASAGASARTRENLQRLVGSVPHHSLRTNKWGYAAGKHRIESHNRQDTHRVAIAQQRNRELASRQKLLHQRRFCTSSARPHSAPARRVCAPP